MLVLIAFVLILLWIRSAQQRRALEYMLTRDRYLSRIALLRYVQLRHQCTEDAAYQRIANFAKKHVLPEDQSYIESMAVYDRQGLLAYAQSILAQNPDEIDEI